MDNNEPTPSNTPPVEPVSPATEPMTEPAPVSEPPVAPATEPVVEPVSTAAEPIAEPAPAVESAPATPSLDSAEPVSSTPFTFPETKKKSPLVPILLVVLLLLLAGGAAAYYLLVYAPTKTANTVVEVVENLPDLPETSDETEMTDATAISSLFSKLFLLHNPFTTEEKFSSAESAVYSKNNYFDFHNSYQVNDNFYTDISKFGEPEKIYIITDYLRQNEPDSFKSLSDLNIPEDFFKQEGYDTLSESDIVAASKSAAIPESEVEKLYLDLFGEGIAHQNPAEICGRLKYNSEYHIYYKEPVGGCGGVDMTNHQLYIEKYTSTPDSAFVYARVNTIRNDAMNEEGTGVAIYKSYLNNSAFYDPATSQQLTPDADLLYGYTSVTSGYPIQITSENFQEFAPYRFIFTKSGDNYIFKTVEKL